MKTPNVTGARLKSRGLQSFACVKSLFLLGAAFALMGSTELRAGVQFWDPDGDPSNNNVNGTGVGALGNVTLPVSTPTSPLYWESSLWTDDSNLPASITNPLGGFNEGDDAVFWGIQVGSGTTPDLALQLNAPHTVNSLSFYSSLSSGTTYNYWLGGSDPNYLTNLTGVINCDGGIGSHANTYALVTTIQVPLVTTNGLHTYGSGLVSLAANMAISGGPIVISGCTRPGYPGGIKLPTATQWNTTVNGPYQPFPLDSQIILTNGAALTLNGTRLITSQPLVIWDGNIAGVGGVQAPQYIVRTCRYGYNNFTEVLNDDGSGNTTLLKIGQTYFGMGVITNLYKGGTLISQGAVQWLQCDPSGSCLGTNVITLGDTNTGSYDIGCYRGSTAPSTLNTNLVNNIVVTTNGTGRVFIGNQACAGVIRQSGNISLGRSVILGGSGSAINGPNYTIAQRGAIFDGVLSGPGGVSVLGAANLFFSPTDAFTSSQPWYSGGTVELTNPNSSYSGGSTVNWGTLEAAANGSLGTGNVTVNSPGILQLDTIQGLSPNANLTLAGATPLVNLNYSGTGLVNALSTNGGLTYATSGTFGSPTSGAATTSSLFSNNGVLKVVTTQTGSTTTLASSLNPANLNTNYGMTVKFTATVASVAAGTPTGTVTFMNGTGVLGTSLLSGGVASFTTNNLPAGTNAITAWYGGDVHFVPSGTLPLSQVVYTTLSTNNTAVGLTTSGPGTFTLAFHGTPGVYYSAVTSTNAAAPMANWTVVPGSTTLVTDLVAGNWSVVISNTSPAQYYRAKVVGIAP
jgi:autotransporter-associated beta strand protein